MTKDPAKARLKIIVAAGLCALTLAAYWRVLSLGYIENYDDYYYILANDRMADGLTWDNVRWSFTTTYLANWHPLTWLSYFADVSAFGLRPSGFHQSNLLLHMANGVLLFLVLLRLTNAMWKSAVVAALYVVHPLHVESVAWISERKDVLSAFFWLAAMLAYVHYVKKPSLGTYCAVLMLFALGLMAKPMVITLPCALLLLDYWPLRRISPDPEVDGVRSRPWPALVVEKIPMLALSLASAVVTVWAQQTGGAIQTFESLTLANRVGNAIWAYAQYLYKTIWPFDLAVFYPIPAGGVPVSDVIVSAAVLGVITVAAVNIRKRAPELVVGWLWFLGTLVPVIGILQVGAQAMADRYTYIPHIGLFVAIVWLVTRAIPERSTVRYAATATTVFVVAGLAFLTARQTTHWQDGETLFRHTASVTKDNYSAHFSLGFALEQQGRIDEAVAEYGKAVNLRSTFLPSYLSLARVLRNRGQADEALQHLRVAESINPDFPELRTATSETLNVQGRIRAAQGNLDAAAESFESALAVNEGNIDARVNLGTVMAIQGKLAQAIQHFEDALALDPPNLGARLNLIRALEDAGRIQDALDRVNETLEMGLDAPALREARERLQNRVESAESGRTTPDLFVP